MENRRDLYTDKIEERKRRIGHFGLRCVEPEQCAEFYRDVFELAELEKPGGDPNHYLSDGKVTLAVMPWKIADFYEDEVDAAVKDMLTLMEPVMIVFLGVVVGGIIISLYLPLFSLIAKLSG